MSVYVLVLLSADRQAVDCCDVAAASDTEADARGLALSLDMPVAVGYEIWRNHKRVSQVNDKVSFAAAVVNDPNYLLYTVASPQSTAAPGVLADGF
jgi:hypothetical protein